MSATRRMEDHHISPNKAGPSGQQQQSGAGGDSTAAAEEVVEPFMFPELLSRFLNDFAVSQGLQKAVDDDSAVIDDIDENPPFGGHEEEGTAAEEETTPLEAAPDLDTFLSALNLLTGRSSGTTPQHELPVKKEGTTKKSHKKTTTLSPTKKKRKATTQKQQRPSADVEMTSRLQQEAYETSASSSTLLPQLPSFSLLNSLQTASMPPSASANHTNNEENGPATDGDNHPDLELVLNNIQMLSNCAAGGEQQALFAQFLANSAAAFNCTAAANNNESGFIGEEEENPAEKGEEEADEETEDAFLRSGNSPPSQRNFAEAFLTLLASSTVKQNNNNNNNDDNKTCMVPSGADEVSFQEPQHQFQLPTNNSQISSEELTAAWLISQMTQMGVLEGVVDEATKKPEFEDSGIIDDEDSSFLGTHASISGAFDPTRMLVNRPSPSINHHDQPPQMEPTPAAAPKPTRKYKKRKPKVSAAVPNKNPENPPLQSYSYPNAAAVDHQSSSPPSSQVQHGFVEQQQQQFIANYVNQLTTAMVASVPPEMLQLIDPQQFAETVRNYFINSTAVSLPLWLQQQQHIGDGRSQQQPFPTEQQVPPSSGTTTFPPPPFLQQAFHQQTQQQQPQQPFFPPFSTNSSHHHHHHLQAVAAEEECCRIRSEGGRNNVLGQQEQHNTPNNSVQYTPFRLQQNLSSTDQNPHQQQHYFPTHLFPVGAGGMTRPHSPPTRVQHNNNNGISATAKSQRSHNNDRIEHQWQSNEEKMNGGKYEQQRIEAATSGENGDPSQLFSRNDSKRKRPHPQATASNNNNNKGALVSNSNNNSTSTNALHTSSITVANVLKSICMGNLSPHHQQDGGSEAANVVASLIATEGSLEELTELDEFANLFKKQRIKHGFTQGDVGAAIGKRYGTDFSQTTISRFEALNLSYKNMCKLRPLLKEWLEETGQLIAAGATSADILEGVAPDRFARNGSCESAAAQDQQSQNGEATNSGSNGDEPISAAVTPPIPFKKRRKRTNLDNGQKMSLDAYFNLDPRPDNVTLIRIANCLNLDNDVVRVWFCNRRQKCRKD